jgi:membrane protein involved in colicin uptake
VVDKARCDRDVFEEAERSVKAAVAQLTEARMAAGQAAADNIPDSPAISSASAGLPALSATLTALQARLRQPHQDWNGVDADADRIASEAARATATLRGELARAQAVLSAMSTAATAVRNAGAWTGGFGVLILGSPGSDTLEGARAWLQRGDYERARSNAETARRVAEAAIAQAVAEMERRRQAEIARIEREQRRRAMEAAARAARASSRSSSGGFGGFGGFGGGGGFSGGGSSSWGSSGSGFGSSSSGGGGSGFRTSGW